MYTSQWNSVSDVLRWKWYKPWILHSAFGKGTGNSDVWGHKSSSPTYPLGKNYQVVCSSHHENESSTEQMRGHQGLGGRGEWGMTTHNGYRVSFWGDENVLELDSGDGCTTFWMHAGSHWMVHFKCTFKMVKIMNLIWCEFYLKNNKWIQEQDMEYKSSSEKKF